MTLYIALISKIKHPQKLLIIDWLAYAMYFIK